MPTRKIGGQNFSSWKKLMIFAIVIVVAGGLVHSLTYLGLSLQPANLDAQAEPISGDWTRLFPSPNAGARKSSAWAYDPIHDVIILFGGVPDGAETWIFHPDTESWEQKFPNNSPPGRSVHQMAFDTENGVAVIFGGLRSGHGSELGDTWAYDYGTNTWTRIITPASPPDRHWGGLVYEPVAKKVVLFGGHENIPGAPDKMYNDVWLLDVDAKTWTKVQPKDGNVIPSPRQTFPIYNSDDGLVYIFGGKYEDAGVRADFYNDVWSYNVATNTWARVLDDSDSAGKPIDQRAKWAFDPNNNYGILFNENGSTAQTWIFDFDAKEWSRVNTDTIPAPRLAHVIIYYPMNDEVLLYGGISEDRTTLQDLWQLDYPDRSGSGYTCAGQIATIIGTQGSDTLSGTEGEDIIVGLGGDDVIRSLGGSDIICGGQGNDEAYGGSGNDRVFGEDGSDALYGNDAHDELRGGSGSDALYGGLGIDTAYGETATDSCQAETKFSCES